MTRFRKYLLAAFIVLAGCALIFASETGRYAILSFVTEDFAGKTFTAPEAHSAAAKGEIILIDIRRPDEWTQTGYAENAKLLDMRDPDFIRKIRGLKGAKSGAPIALICARGVRSASLANKLAKAGFTKIIDIPEGMLGSAAGPGWLKRGLPIKSYQTTN